MRGELSPFVLDCVRKLELPICARVLDIPAGRGRHARWLAERGYFVVAADIDEGRLAGVAEGSPSHMPSPVVLDADRPLPFEPAAFDLVLVVHFFRQGFAKRVAGLLKTGGHLIVETFGGQGGNWQDLPLAGTLRDEASARLTVRKYVERAAGPGDQGRVVAKLLATRMGKP